MNTIGIPKQYHRHTLGIPWHTITLPQEKTPKIDKLFVEKPNCNDCIGWYSYGNPIVYLWISPCLSLVLLWCSHGRIMLFLLYPWVFPWSSYGIPMVLRWHSYGRPMVVPLFPMVFLCYSCGVPMVFLWRFDGTPMVFLWYCYGIPAVLLWYSYSDPMAVVLWHSLVFQW